MGLEEQNKKVIEIVDDHEKFMDKEIKRFGFKSALDVCNHYAVLRFAFAFEITEYLTSYLANYNDDDEKRKFLLNTNHVFDKIITWYDEQEYSPNMSSWSEIDDWFDNCMDEIKTNNYYNGGELQ